MTSTERNELDHLIQRLYGGPADGEIGDIISIKQSLSALQRDLLFFRGVAWAVLGIVGFVGFGGLVAVGRALAGQ